MDKQAVEPVCKTISDNLVTETNSVLASLQMNKTSSTY